MQKTYDVCRHKHTNEIQLLSKTEQHHNRNFEVIGYKDLTVNQLSEILKEVYPYRYKEYVNNCMRKYSKVVAKQKIYDSAVTGELQ